MAHRNARLTMHARRLLVERFWRASHISDSGPNKVPFEMEEHRCGRSAGNSLRSSSLKRFVL
jgi:hypothetical protein